MASVKAGHFFFNKPFIKKKHSNRTGCFSIWKWRINTNSSTNSQHKQNLTTRSQLIKRQFSSSKRVSFYELLENPIKFSLLCDFSLSSCDKSLFYSSLRLPWNLADRSISRVIARHGDLSCKHFQSCWRLEDLQENGDRSVKFFLGYIFGNVHHISVRRESKFLPQKNSHRSKSGQ
jgi:hypothetical protein